MYSKITAELRSKFYWSHIISKVCLPVSEFCSLYGHGRVVHYSCRIRRCCAHKTRDCREMTSATGRNTRKSIDNLPIVFPWTFPLWIELLRRCPSSLIFRIFLVIVRRLKFVESFSLARCQNKKLICTVHEHARNWTSLERTELANRKQIKTKRTDYSPTRPIQLNW